VVQYLQVVDRHTRELRTNLQHRANVVRVASAHGVDQPADCRAVHERLQFGPALEAVRARDNELGVVQRKCLRIGAMKLPVDLGALAFPEGFEKLLRLAFELLQVRSLRKSAAGEGLSRHDELLSGRQLAVHAPGVRSLGQKRVHRSHRFANRFRWTQSFPRTRRRPDALHAA